MKIHEKMLKLLSFKDLLLCIFSGVRSFTGMDRITGMDIKFYRNGPVFFLFFIFFIFLPSNMDLNSPK